MNGETKYWIALSTHSQIGGRTFQKILRHFDLMSKLWLTSYDKLISFGFDVNQAKAIMEVIGRSQPEETALKVERAGLRVITFVDKSYPAILKEISDPPGLLYVKGEILPQDEVSLAVVGSRKYTSYGKRAVEKLVYPLSKAGLTIISGLALGIDTLAHMAALEAGGRTIGVLGCGLNQIYPAANYNLATEIVKRGGAIISEFPLGMPALKQNFAIRNRIIAGLSLGTLVIEAGLESGTLLTAKSALDYNREVFAVPGSIFEENSAGPHKLIKSGAKLISEAQDVLEELNLENLVKKQEVKEILVDCLEEETMIKLLKKPILIDDLVRESGFEAALVNATLIMLEMKGMILNLGGGRYVKK